MHFLITGDSWSQGEWDGYPTDYHVSHPGIEQYLIDDGHSVTNVGKGGYNNNESFDAINGEFDHLIFFYTDPLRQATEQQIKLLLPFDIITDHNINLHSNLVCLKQTTDCKITIIGGCAKYVGSAESINYLVPSISELLVPGFEDTEFMGSREWEKHFFKHERNFTVEQKSQWLTVMSRAGEKYTIWNKNKEMFWPDGLHANRHGTQKVYEYLKQLWLNV